MLKSVLGEYRILFCSSAAEYRHCQAVAEALLPLLDGRQERSARAATRIHEYEQHRLPALAQGCQRDGLALQVPQCERRRVSTDR